jgi:hypothetical protein
MEPKFIIIGCVILILLLVFVNAHANYELYDDMLGGMWVSDPEWAEQADLDGMLLFIGPCDSWISDTRKCYLIMHADNRVIINKQIEMKISSGITVMPSKQLSCNVNVKDLEEPEEDIDIVDEDDTIPFEDIMPNDMTLELGISSGKLVLKGIDDDGEVIHYAKLYKDAVATEISRDHAEKEQEQACDESE